MSVCRRILLLLVSATGVGTIANSAEVPEPLLNMDKFRCQDVLTCGNHYGHKHVTDTAATIADSTGQVYENYVGRLFFTKDGEIHYCTAQFVEQHVILTAAHCTNDSSDFCYIGPGEAFNESTSCKTEEGNGIKAVCVAENPNWVDAKTGQYAPDNLYIAARYDYAFLRMEEAGPAGGGFKTRPLQGSTKELKLVGYPPPNTASKTLALSYGGFKDLPGGEKNKKYVDWLHPKLMAAGARLMDPESENYRFGPGISGGAWFHRQSGNLEIVSVNSSYTRDLSTTYEVIYGPTFDDDTLAYRAAAADPEPNDKCPP